MKMWNKIIFPSEALFEKHPPAGPVQGQPNASQRHPGVLMTLRVAFDHKLHRLCLFALYYELHAHHRAKYIISHQNNRC